MVHDANGRVLANSWLPNTGEAVLEITSLKAGTYVLDVFTTSGLLRKLLIKE